jgi:hypothetical protein
MFTRIALPLVLVLSLAGCGSKDAGNAPQDANAPKGADAAKGGPRTVAAADEEFRTAASHKGDRAQAVAKMMVEQRRDDRWTWERLEKDYGDELNETKLRDEFATWKKNRTAAGDKAK